VVFICEFICPDIELCQGWKIFSFLLLILVSLDPVHVDVWVALKILVQTL
jgi:hypothetical protein